MSALLHRIARGVRAIERIGARGIRRWSETPVGVQVGCIVGAVFAVNVWDGTAWTALLLLLWSAPGWIERVTPGSIKRFYAAIRRKPVVALFAVSAPVALLHPVIVAAEKAGETGLLGATIGLLLPLLLGIPPEHRRAATAITSPIGASVGPASPITTWRPADPSFVSRPGMTGWTTPEPAVDARPRLTHVGPSVLTIVGALTVVVATYLPWLWLENVPGFGAVALDGLYGQDHALTDGAVTLVGGVILAVAGAARLSARGHAGWRRGVAIALGIGLATIAVWLAGALATDLAALTPPASGTVGPGIVAVGFGGAIAMVGGLLPGRPVLARAPGSIVGVSTISPARASRTGLFVRGPR